MAQAILRLRSISRTLSIYAVEVLARLNDTIDAIETAYREYQFNTVAQRLYDFVWSDYCDWFVEAAKTDIFGERRSKEEIRLGSDGFCVLGDIAVAASFHAAFDRGALVVTASRDRLDSVCGAAGKARVRRGCRCFGQASPSLSYLRNGASGSKSSCANPSCHHTRKICFILRTDEKSIFEQIHALTRLLNAEDVTLEPEYQAPPGTPVAVTPLGEIFLPIAAADQARERERLDREIAQNRRGPANRGSEITERRIRSTRSSARGGRPPPAAESSQCATGEVETGARRPELKTILCSSILAPRFWKNFFSSGV